MDTILMVSIVSNKTQYSSDNVFDTEKEFFYFEKDFKKIQSLIYEIAGIALSEHKIQLVYSRLAPRIRACHLESFKAYIHLIESDADEKKHFINALTTNKTSFFRESHHFDYLENSIVKTLSNKQNELKIWSAGCSSGEEPYTLAMTLHRHIQKFSKGIQILATDLDTKVLEKAKAGIYDLQHTEGLNEKLLKKFFLKGKNRQQGKIKITSVFDDMITFKPLNLMSNWPIDSLFDVIFCRNVVIYFDKPTQKKLFQRFYRQLKPKGWLIIGHSESFEYKNLGFDFLGKTIYQKG